MRNQFDLSHEHKLSVDMGYLVPVMTEEVLPGDTFIGNTALLARVAPLAHPVMHNVEIRTHHWYVPNRILWSGWEDYITGVDDVTAKPTITAANATEAALYDHMGAYPSTSIAYDALPVRAYNKIYNEFYRDQDLQVARGEDDLGLARICWGKDYFTTCRPSPQQGDAVELGFSAGQAPVTGFGVGTTGANGAYTETGGGTGTYSNYISADVDDDNITTTPLRAKFEMNGDSVEPALYADLTNASGGIDLDDLRRSLALQRFAEARSRFGSRYADYLRFIGVNPSDGRLDRPEYIGGGKSDINFSEVLATAEGTSTEVGDLYGHGIASMRSRTYRKMFEEHGWIMTLISVRPTGVYQEAVPRKFTRSDAMDYWQKELEVLPWQEVNEREIYHGGNAATVFGYAPRYNEYRHAMNFVSGTFRGGTEQDWHMARLFGSAPTLNSSFVECTPTDRVYQDTSMPELLINAYNRVKARRFVRKSASLQGI